VSEEQEKSKLRQGASKIEELKKDLYAREFPSSAEPSRSHLSPDLVDVNTKWQPPTPPPFVPPPPPKVTSGSFFRKILTFSLIFFLFSAAIAVFIFIRGFNIVSGDRVAIAFLGPTAIGASEELTFDIVIENKNQIALESAELFIDFPDGTKQVTDITQDLLHQKESVITIPAQTDIRRTVRAILFGEQNAKKEIVVALEYGIKNSNGRFRKEQTYSVTINSAPLTLTVPHPQEVISNQEVEFEAIVTSNSTKPLSSLLVDIDYPFGFSFKSADPQPTYANSVWLIPNLAPGEQKKIKVRGKIEGEEGDERVFRLSVGTQSVKDEKVIATKYIGATESMMVKKSPLAVVVYIDTTTTKEYVTTLGSVITGRVEITNNLPQRLLNGKIQVKFSGAIFEPQSPKTEQGFYRSTDKTIVWDRTNLNQLTELSPGETVSAGFTFSTIAPTAGAIKNGTMQFTAIGSGERITESQMRETINVSVDRIIKTRTSIGIVPRIVYSIGPFRNTGPIPPQAEAKTTYTVVWTLTNSANDVVGAEVRARLPNYVTWLNQVSPTNEKITWNPDQNEVVWRVGDIPAGTGIHKPAREAAFQIEFAPSTSQLGSQPLLVGNIIMKGTDGFTNAELSTSPQQLDTTLSTDPRFTTRDGIVTK